MDEAGTPFGVTVDGETITNRTVTVRHRDTMQQERVGMDRVAEYVKDKVSGKQ
jgi:glycyl-tRNA synthetase